jgi:hypothetical protein
MSKKLSLMSGIAGVAVMGALLGFAGASIAADAVDRLKTTTDGKVADGIYAFNGETPEQMKRAAESGITAYEPEDKAGGGGAPQKVLVDNDVTRVNLVAFKKGFIRPGDLKRRHHQLLVYVDEGRYTIRKSGGQPRNPNATPNKHAPGSSVFHYKDSLVGESHIDEDYRVLFIEMKK